MKVLIIGSGGREHAIAHKVGQSSLVTDVFVCPGNPGMEMFNSRIKTFNISAENSQSLLDFAIKEKIALTIVGPEAVLSLGIVDLFKAHDLLIVGPSQKASELEVSKSFAKKIMNEAGVPTAGFYEFFDAESALTFIASTPLKQMVVKCDGLASGKGVVVCQNKTEAIDAVNALMKNKLLGENVQHIVIEHFLSGTEVSAFALCDGESFSFLGTACDHKRLRNNDQGPNTGGMGVYSPASVFKTQDELWINEHVFAPILKTMKKRGIPFSGILFAGLMKTDEGWSVLEFNVRLGDPETQVLLPLIEEDLVPWFIAAASGTISDLQKKLNSKSPQKSNLVGVHVVMAAHGYPGTEGEKIRSGDSIHFDKNFELQKGDFLFFAGIGKKETELVTKGGRVLGVTSLRDNFSLARTEVYQLISQIKFAGSQYREDIASGQTCEN